jgi:hypothetical protein
MESSTVRNRLNLIIDAAKRSSAERRARNDVFTPGGSVKLMSDKSAEDYIELSLDSSGDRPAVVGRVSRARGRRVIESEHPVAAKPVGELTEEDVLEFVLKEIGPFVER